jgi:type IX secretion system PorP/SprF family membrane protein
MRKIFLLAAIVTGGISSVSAQQDPQFTMFMFNRSVLNPAYAGTIHATNVTLLGRSQWVGIDGAPQTSTASINGYVKAIHGGVGGYIIGDRLGPLSTIGAKANYSFHLNFGSPEEEMPELNIGVGGGMYSKTLNGIWKYDQDNGIDPELPVAGKTTSVFDIDGGIYFHKPMKNMTSNVEPRDKFYIGATVNHVLEPSLEGMTNGLGQIAVLPMSIQGCAGFTFDLGNQIYLQPNVNYRMAGPLKQFDINANLYISPMVFGISHRWKDSFSGIVGFNATTNLFMGYSYDYTISDVSSFVTGSHEIIISYTFPTKIKIGGPEDGVSRPGAL